MSHGQHVGVFEEIARQIAGAPMRSLPGHRRRYNEVGLKMLLLACGRLRFMLGDKIYDEEMEKAYKWKKEIMKGEKKK